MFNSGAQMPPPERRDRAERPMPFGGDNRLPRMAAITEPPKVVDHDWFISEYETIFAGRDNALNTGPALARFRDFDRGRQEEERATEEAEEREFWDAHQAVYNHIEEILDAAESDHEKGVRVHGLVKAASDRFPDLGNQPDIQMLVRQIGVAGHLYRFAAPNERMARRHAKRLRADLNRERPKFLVLRRNGSLTKEQAERIYGLPVRASLSVLKEDLKPLVASLRAAGEDGRELASSILKTVPTTSEAYAHLRQARLYVAGRTNKSQPDKDGKVVEPDTSPKKLPEFDGYGSDVFAEFDPDEFDDGVRTPEGAGTDEVETAPWDYTHNAIFAALARRDLKALRNLSRSGHQSALATGGPSAYKRKLIEVVGSVKGLRLYVEDFPTVNRVGSGRPALSAVLRAFGLTRNEARPLQAALKNVQWVSERTAAPRKTENVEKAEGFFRMIEAIGDKRVTGRAEKLVREVKKAEEEIAKIQSKFDAYELTSDKPEARRAKQQVEKLRATSSRALTRLRSMAMDDPGRKKGFFGLFGSDHDMFTAPANVTF